MTAPNGTVRPVRAHRWTCHECADTGLEPTPAAAEAELVNHADEYHAPTGPDEFDDLDEEILTFADLADRYRAAWRTTADE